MNNGRKETGREPHYLIPLRHAHYSIFDIYRIANGHAAEAVNSLVEARQRPVRHNRRIERAALWHVLRLADLCDDAIATGSPTLPKKPQATYELIAALGTVPLLLPFSRHDCETLRDSERRGYEANFFSTDIELRQPVLVGRWHAWLWSEGAAGTGDRQTPSHEGMVIEEGCRRLYSSTAEVIHELMPSDPVKG